MKVYVAAPWVKRPEARVVADRLVAHGHTVVSRWLHLHGDTDDPRVLAIEAQNDVDDVRRADVLVLCNLEKSEGKSVETGIALASGLSVIVIGQRSNIFHYLPAVRVVESVDEALQALQQAERIINA